MTEDEIRDKFLSKYVWNPNTGGALYVLDVCYGLVIGYDVNDTSMIEQIKISDPQINTWQVIDDQSVQDFFKMKIGQLNQVIERTEKQLSSLKSMRSLLKGFMEDSKQNSLNSD